MKAEKTSSLPKFNLLQPDGQRQQTNADNVTHVLLNDGKWYRIVEGSFKFYTTGDKGVPFVQFDVDTPITSGSNPVAGKRIEVFPASVCGLAYDAPDTRTEVV